MDVGGHHRPADLVHELRPAVVDEAAVVEPLQRRLPGPEQAGAAPDGDQAAVPVGADLHVADGGPHERAGSRSRAPRTSSASTARPCPCRASRRSAGRRAASPRPSRPRRARSARPGTTQSVSVKTRVSWSSSRSAQPQTGTLLKVGQSAKPVDQRLVDERAAELARGARPSRPRAGSPGGGRTRRRATRRASRPRRAGSRRAGSPRSRAVPCSTQIRNAGWSRGLGHGRRRVDGSGPGRSLRYISTPAARSRLDSPWVTAAFGLAVAILTWDYVQITPAPGIDASWILGLNLATAQGLDYGTQVVFTYGPLGFLDQPMVVDGLLATLGGLLAARAAGGARGEPPLGRASQLHAGPAGRGGGVRGRGHRARPRWDRSRSR